jgi:hypothetical protein
MIRVHYTDLAQRTFDRALIHLDGVVAGPLLDELKRLLESGELHNPDLIIAAVRNLGQA